MNRIINESTSVIMINDPQAIVHVSTTAIPGQIVTVVDATGSVSSQSILISTVGPVRFSDSTSQAAITQRYGYVTLHSDTDDPALWSLVNTHSFPNPSLPADYMAVDANTVQTNHLSNIRMISTAQFRARSLQAISSFHAPGAVFQASSLIVQAQSIYGSTTPADPRAIFGGNTLFQGSTAAAGRFFLEGSLSTGADLFVSRNISSKLGTIFVQGDLTTMSSFRNERGFIVSASSLSTLETALFVQPAVFLNSAAVAGSVSTATAISTSQLRTALFSAASSIRFGPLLPPTPAPPSQYWKYLGPCIEFENLPVTTPSLSTQTIQNADSMQTRTLRVATLSTSETVDSIVLSSASILNPQGSVTLSSLETNNMLSLTSLFATEATTAGLLTTQGILMNTTGPAATNFTLSYPPATSPPDGSRTAPLLWSMSTSQTSAAALSSPSYALSNNFLTTSFVTTSTLATSSLVARQAAINNLTVARTITLISSFIAERVAINNTNGRFLNTTSTSASTLQTSSISTQSITAPGNLTLRPTTRVTISTGSISTVSTNTATTSSIVLTRATFGQTYDYSTIQPYPTWMVPSTFNLSAPPFQATEGKGTYFDRVFFTAARDCTAIYSIIDPRSNTPATLSTLHVNTIAGTGTFGSGSNIGQVYGSPAMDSTFATYFGDNTSGWRLRRIDPSGFLSTMGGRSRYFFGDGGPALLAGIGPRSFVALDSTDSVIVTDISNVRLRRAFFDSNFNTIAGNGDLGYTGDGGLAVQATFSNPSMVAVDSSGTVFVADSSNNVIRYILNSTISTFAGIGTAGNGGDGGLATLAELAGPVGVAVDQALNLYIADTQNHVVRKVTRSTGIITKIAGTYTGGFSGDGGPASSAALSTPKGLAVDVSSNLYIADTDNQRVRRVDAITGTITTLTGTGVKGYGGDNGPATAAVLNTPTGLSSDTSGNIYVADTGNHCVRFVAMSNGVIRRVAGRATQPGFGGDESFATFAYLDTPTSVSFDPVSQRFYIGDQGNNRVRVVDAATNIINTYVGNGSPASGGDNGPVADAVFGSIFGLARDSAYNIYIADGYGNRIRKLVPSTTEITTVVGTGVGGYSGDGGQAALAQISTPFTVFIDSNDNLFFTDSDNQCVRRVNLPTGIITTVAGTGTAGYNGDGGLAVSSLLNSPRALSADTAGNLFIGDTSNFRIRKVAAGSGLITTIAGTGFEGTITPDLPAIISPVATVTGITLDPQSNVYFADIGTSALWKINATTGFLTAFSAAGPGYLNDAAPMSEAVFNLPSALTTDACGNFVIADRANYRIRRSYSYGPPRLPNYLNLDFQFTNYQNPNGVATISLNGNLLAYFDAALLSNLTYRITDSNILSYPLQSSNPARGDQTPWLQIGLANSTDYVQLEGFAWMNQTPAQGLDSTVVNSDAGITVNQGIVRFPNRVNGITIDNKFNDLSTRTINYTGSLFVTSDPQLKEKVADADLYRCTAALDALPLKCYAYRPEVAHALHMEDRRRLGYLTTDVATQFPKSIGCAAAPAAGLLSSFETLDTTQLKFAHLGTTKALLEQVSTLEATVAELLCALKTAQRNSTPS